MTCRVGVVGSANLDVMLRTASLPRPGETVLAQSCQFGSGGKGANQAIMAARLGAEVVFVARLGRDGFGNDLLRCYEREGLALAHLVLDDVAPTGLAMIAVDDAAENAIIVAPGANARLTPADVQKADVALSRCQVVVGQFEVPQETTLAAFAIARRHGAMTLLNPAPAQTLNVALLEAVDCLLLNEVELEVLTGQGVNPKAGVAERALHLLRTPGPRALVVTLGANGALLVEPTGSERFVAPRVQAVDTTGAGDAFVGSLAAALAEGQILREAIPFAMAAAAISVTRPGTQAAYPRRSEVEEMLRTGLPRAP
jgi:ribokinase